jgi:hypothetical protein
MSHRIITHALNDSSLETANLTRLQQQLDQLPPAEPMQRIIAEGERLTPLSFLQDVRRGRTGLLEQIRMMQSVSQAEAGPSFFVSDRPERDVFAETIRSPAFDIDHALQRMNEVWDRHLTDLPEDPQHLRERTEQLSAALNDAVDRIGGDPGNRFSSLAAQAMQLDEADAPARQKFAAQMADLLLHVLVPAVDGALIREAETRVAGRLIRIGLQLERARLRDGRYPADLTFLAQLDRPIETNDPFTDQPLRYHPDDAGFLLYSVGSNGRDDGGLDDHQAGDLVLRIQR